LHGMACAWADLVAQGGGVGVDSSRWLIEHLLQAEGTDPARVKVVVASFMQPEAEYVCPRRAA
jgi:hypothetical protein